MTLVFIAQIYMVYLSLKELTATMVMINILVVQYVLYGDTKQVK